MLSEILVFLTAALAIASGTSLIGRWIERRRPPADEAMAARLARLEQLAESTAHEVERLVEAQRFTSSLLAGRMAGDRLVTGERAAAERALVERPLAPGEHRAVRVR